MSRWKAFAIHLSISAVIGATTGALLFLLWYPPPFFHAAGADKLVLLLVGVDVVLGPLLTLLIFRSGKKGLKFDLTLIATVQSLALVYGLSVMLRSRPVFLVVVDRLVLVSATDLDAIDLAKGIQPDFRSLSWTGPRMVGAQLPSNETERTHILQASFKGKNIDRMPQYYVSYAQLASQLLGKAKPLDQLSSRKADTRELLWRAVAELGKSADQIAWLPITTRKESLVMLLDKSSGTPLRAVAIDPWDG